MVIKVCDFATKGIILNGAPSVQSGKEQVCYDLHVGESIKFPGDETRHSTPKKIRLKPNDCVRIETREVLRVPSTVFGVVCSRASLTAEGLVVANLKIDPLFQGKLVVTVYNTSKNIILINGELPFCSVFFQMLENPVPGDSPIRTPPDSKIMTGNRKVEGLIRSLPFVATFIASVLAPIITSYISDRFHAQPKQVKQAPPIPAIIEPTTLSTNKPTNEAAH